MKISIEELKNTATEAYTKHFPEYIDEAIEPEEIALFAVKLASEEITETGQVFVLKKDQEPYQQFHA